MLWRGFVIIAAACVFLSPSLARAGDVYFFSYLDTNGKWFDDAALVITDEALTRTPAWKPASGDPPLSAREAIRRAEISKRKFIADLNEQQKWNLFSAALVPAEPRDSGRWYWLVTYEIRDNGTGPPPQLRIGVLMDGTVVEPTRDVRSSAWPVLR